MSGTVQGSIVNFTINDVQDGDTLVYNQSASRWENGTASSNFNPTITDPQNNDYLVYDLSLTEWVNTPLNVVHDSTLQGDGTASSQLGLIPQLSIGSGSWGAVTVDTVGIVVAIPGPVHFMGLNTTIGTTDATTTTIMTIPIVTNNVAIIEYQVAAAISPVASSSACFQNYVQVQNDVGTVTKNDGTQIKLPSGTSWTVTTSVSSTNLLINVTGAASTDITWNCIARWINNQGS
jgi:hypothetical protein